MTESEIRDLFAPETGAVILDTETTGLHDDAEIIELAIISAATGETLYNQRFNPHGEMNPDSQKIHGITPADLAACPRFSERIPEVQPLIEAAPVLAWYATFDQSKLQAEFARAAAPPGHCLKNWHCASVLYHHLAFGHTIQTVTLQGACRLQNIPPTALHTALGDTTTIRRILLSALDSP